MTDRQPVDAAEAIFRRLGGFPANPPGGAPGVSVGFTAIPRPAQLFAAVEAFEPVDFAVAEHLPEQDCFFFQYATVTTFGPGVGFVLGIVRQFEVVDPDGEHLGFVQLQAEYRFAPDHELTALGHHEDFWFRGGAEPFETWFARITADPVWRFVETKPALDFEIRQEWV
jgi:hypothetical protein